MSTTKLAARLGLDTYDCDSLSEAALAELEKLEAELKTNDPNDVGMTAYIMAIDAAARVAIREGRADIADKIRALGQVGLKK